MSALWIYLLIAAAFFFSEMIVARSPLEVLFSAIGGLVWPLLLLLRLWAALCPQAAERLAQRLIRRFTERPQ